MVEYSIWLVLKSGKVLYSDPELVTMDVADKFHNQFADLLEKTNTQGCVKIIRNGRAVLVPVLSIDYVEITTDLPEETK